MKTSALVLTLAALAAAPAALADGGPMYTMQGGSGIAASRGGLHYIAIPTASGDTTLVMEGKDGSIWNWTPIAGAYGIPMVTYRDAGGLSRDGRLLYLQSTAYGGQGNTSFDVVDLKSLTVRDSFFLKGQWAFDALSPNGRYLYLTQHLDTNYPSHYVVRKFDLVWDKLIPGRVADRTQRSWVMQGDAMTRTTSRDGRWVYTLYANSGGYPFIHALDTVRGVAHCIGLPWKSPDQSAMGNVVLTLHGPRLAVHWRSGKPWLNLDTRTWRVTPAARGGFPWLWLLTGLAPLAAAMELLRRRRRNTPVSVEGGTNGPPARSRSRGFARPRLRTVSVRRLPRTVRRARWAGGSLE